MHRERFAPSPTGPLHLGHAFSALTAFDRAMAAGGEFLLRIEDIDQTRSRPDWEAQICDDLAWLGIVWEEPVLRQSDRMGAYRAALQSLWDRDLLYPCTCSRRDIEAALSAPQEGVPTHGPDGVLYPGTCRGKGDIPRSLEPMPEDVALRLDMGLAALTVGRQEIGPERLGRVLDFRETGPTHAGRQSIDTEKLPRDVGDIVLARKGWGTSYHLAVVLDDAHQEITHVTRGEDLFEATAIHVLLQALLDMPTPEYHHHRLIRDDAGKRLAKRDDARAIARYRADGMTPQDLRALLGLA